MSTRTQVSDTIFFNNRWRRRRYAEVMLMATFATSTYGVIPVDAPPTIVIAESASRTVRLPADSTTNVKGLKFTVVNATLATGTSTVTLNTATGAAVSPAIAILKDTAVTIQHMGGTNAAKQGWRVIG